jgi:hypothetical protein
MKGHTRRIDKGIASLSSSERAVLALCLAPDAVENIAVTFGISNQLAGRLRGWVIAKFQDAAGAP